MVPFGGDPAKWSLLDALSKTSSGKIQRFLLRNKEAVRSRDDGDHAVGRRGAQETEPSHPAAARRSSIDCTPAQQNETMSSKTLSTVRSVSFPSSPS